MKTKEKIELFLQQLVAIELHKPLEQIDVNVGFYQEGLRSLQMVSIVKAIENKVKDTLLPSLLFKYTNIRQLSDYLYKQYESEFTRMIVRRKRKVRQRSVTPEVEQTPLPARVPLSTAQKGLWALQQMHTEMYAYNVPLCCHLQDELDSLALQQAPLFLLQQYPILGAEIEEKDGELCHITQTQRPLQLVQEDISGLDADQILSYLRQQAKSPFDLKKEPLLRIQIYTHGPRDYYLLFSIHHIVFDGVSYIPFLKTLWGAYRNVLQGRKPQSVPRIQPYLDFIAREQAMLQGADGTKRLRYWRKQIEGDLPVLQMPTDRPRSSRVDFAGGTHSELLSADLSARLKAFANTQQCYFSTLFLGIFKLLLYRYTGERDVIVGMVTNQRTGQSLQNSIGFFVDMLPVRCLFVEHQDFAYFLQRLQKTLLDGLAHGYPFPALVQALNLPYTATETPVFQVSFTYQDALDAAQLEATIAETSVPFQLFDGLYQEGAYELALEIFDLGEQFALYIKYNPSLYDTATIAHLMQHYKTLLGAVLEEPQHLPEGYCLITAQERQT